MKAILLPHGRNLIEEVIASLSGCGKDFSARLVVFPGRRPSHFLRKGLAQRCGSSFIPPAVFSIDNFIDFLYEQKRTDRKLETIDAVSVLYDIHRKSEKPLGGKGFMTPDSFFPIGLKIYRDLEELHVENVPSLKVREIQPLTDEIVPAQTVERLQSLSFFYEEFYRAVEERGFSTRSVRYRRTAEDFEGSETENFSLALFAGFFALTECEKGLFRKLSSLENTLFLFQEGPSIEEKLAELGIEFEKRGGGDPSPEVSFYSSPDSHGQVYALNSVLQAGKHIPDATTAIVLPSSEMLFPLLRQSLSLLAEEDYNVSLGYPLHRTPLFGFLNNLMELLTSMDGERVYVPDYLRFVLHPYTKNIFFKGNAETTRVLFHTIEEVLTKHRTKTFLTLAEIEDDRSLFERVEEKFRAVEGATEGEIKKHIRGIHKNTIEKFLSFRDVKDFALKCTELVTYIFTRSTARMHPLFHPFAESLIRALDLLARSLMKDVAFSERTSYFTFFRKYIMTCSSPFEGTPLSGLQVLGFLETRCLGFEKVFVLDANEEAMPDTRKEDTLLPFRARRVLGLPTYADRDRLSEYYFETLMRGAKEVHLFFVENDTKERSRFVEKLLWEKQKKDRTTETGKYLKKVQYRVRLKNSDPAEIRKTENVITFLRDFTYSASSLDTYLSCPLRFYFSHVLGIGRKEELSGDIERKDIGKFVHEAISRYFATRTGFLLRETDVDSEEMERLAGNLFDLKCGKDPAGAVYLLKRQIQARLKELLLNYYLPLIRRSDFIVLAHEREMGVTHGPFSLSGRPDSIESRAGKVFIVDYKTGASPSLLKTDFDKLDPENRQSWNEAVGSLQLPFYLLLYSKERGEDIRNLEGMFLLLGRSQVNEEMEVRLFGDYDPEKTFGAAEQVITGLLEEIVDREVPFRPTPDKKDACRRCDYHYVCGTQWVTR